MMTFLLIVAALAAMAAPRSRPAFGFLLLVVFLSIAGNLENPDRINYSENFDGIRVGGQDDSFEPGYQALARVASAIGLDYGAFHFAMTAVAVLLIARTILDFTDRPGLALFAYICFPFFWDVTQVRNFYAMSIVLFGMRYLLDEQRASTIKYSVAIFCASLFHLTTAFYLLFLLAKVRNKVVLWTGLGLAAIAYLFVFSALVSSPLLAFIGDKIDVYTTTETSVVTKAAVWAFYLSSIAMLWWARLRICSPAATFSPGDGAPTLPPASSTWPRSLSPVVLLNVNLVAGLSILLALDNLDFIRLFRNIFLINCMFMINGIYADPRHRTLISLCFLLYLAAAFIGFVLVTSTSNIIESTLLNNAING